MAASSKFEDPTVLASATDRATASSSSLFFTAHTGSIVEQIEHSKAHWSQVVEFDSDDEVVAEIDNLDVFKRLQMHPRWGTFFVTFGDGEDDRGELVVGKKFAEGGQAELYEAHVRWKSPILYEFVRKQRTKYVLKVFKKGTFLRHLESQWPQGMLQFHAEKFETRDCGTVKFGPRYLCDVVRATLLRDGKFVFLMVREKGDLRSVIDNIMLRKAGQDSGPFVTGLARRIMYEVAKGMDSLHKRDIIHRDLKASNVLVTMDSNYIVADFESSIGVVGTGFFRAPEILQACKDGNVNQRPELFTKEVDIYGYGMTCYEILTGKHPFEDHSSRDYDVVLKGLRPKIPEYVDDWAHELLDRCWQSNPTMRPSFSEILKILNPMEGGEVLSNGSLKGEVRRNPWAIPSWLRRLVCCIVPGTLMVPCSSCTCVVACSEHSSRHHPAFPSFPGSD